MYGEYLQLSDFLSSLSSGILNCHCHCVHHIPKRRISTLAASGHRRRLIDGGVASGVRVCSGADTAWIVKIRVDEFVDAACNSCRPCYLRCSWNSSGVARNCTLCSSCRWGLGQRLHGCNLEATERKSRVAKSKSELVAWSDVVPIKVLVVDI